MGFTGGIKSLDTFADKEVRHATRTKLGAILTILVPILTFAYLAFIIVYETKLKEPVTVTEVVSSAGQVHFVTLNCETELCAVQGGYASTPDGAFCLANGAQFGCQTFRFGESRTVPICLSGDPIDGVKVGTIDSVNNNGTAAGRRSSHTDNENNLLPVGYNRQPSYRNRKSQLRRLEKATNREASTNAIPVETTIPQDVLPFKFGGKFGFSINSNDIRLPMYAGTHILTRSEVLENLNPWRFQDDNTPDEVYYTTAFPELTQEVSFKGCGADFDTTSVNTAHLKVEPFFTKSETFRPSIYVQVVSNVGGFISIVLQVFAIIVLGYRMATKKDREARRASHRQAGDREMQGNKYIATSRSVARGGGAAAPSSVVAVGSTDGTTVSSSVSDEDVDEYDGSSYY